MVQSAALQLAGSRCAFDRGELLLGSRLADASRANLASARDECARAARPTTQANPDWLPVAAASTERKAT